MGRDGRITVIDSLLADPMNQPFDRLGSNLQLGQRGQPVGGLLEGDLTDAGMDDLLLDTRAEARLIKAQCLVLREKKSAGSGDSIVRVRSR
jgi:hypothetical protein